MSDYKFIHGVDGRFITHRGRWWQFAAMETPIPYSQFEVQNLVPPTLATTTYTATGTYFDIRLGTGGKGNGLMCDLMLVHVPGKRIKLDFAWGHGPTPEPGLTLTLGAARASFGDYIDLVHTDGPSSTKYFDFSPDNRNAYYRSRVPVYISAAGWWGIYSDAFIWCSLSLSLVDAP